MAWVEMYFASNDELRSIDCATCYHDLRERRTCELDKWDYEVSAAYPVRITTASDGYPFCPGKLKRDDPEFVERMKYLWLAWKTGTFDIDGCDDFDFRALSVMIRAWTEFERAKDFRTLAKVLGGS